MELRTARAWGVPLSTIRRGKRRWSDTDRRLALALTAYEDGLCPHCGQPRDRAWNEDMEGWYTVHRARCLSCHAKHLESDSQKPGPAEFLWITDDSPPGMIPDPRMTPK